MQQCDRLQMFAEIKEMLCCVKLDRGDQNIMNSNVNASTLNVSNLKTIALSMDTEGPDVEEVHRQLLLLIVYH